MPNSTRVSCLENPEAYFAKFEVENDIKDQDIQSKMSASDEPLLIYITNIYNK